MEVFLPRFVEGIYIHLNVPHTYVIKQGDGEQNFGERYDQEIHLYFVQKGSCRVTVRDKRGREIGIRMLYQGDHFGEISLMYGCKRTANIISQNYNTYAVLEPTPFIRLI